MVMTSFELYVFIHFYSFTYFYPCFFLTMFCNNNYQYDFHIIVNYSLTLLFSACGWSWKGSQYVSTMYCTVHTQLMLCPHHSVCHVIVAKLHQVIYNHITRLSLNFIVIIVLLWCTIFWYHVMLWCHMLFYCVILHHVRQYCVIILPVWTSEFHNVMSFCLSSSCIHVLWGVELFSVKDKH